MPLIVHWNEKFEKRLSCMRNAGGNAALAAGNAEQIIETLKREGMKGLFKKQADGPSMGKNASEIA